MKYLSIYVIIFKSIINLSAQINLSTNHQDTLFFTNASIYLVPTEPSQAEGYSLDTFNQNIHSKKIMFLGTNIMMIEFECYDKNYPNIDAEAIPVFSIRHGEYTEWYINGVKKLTGFYQNGKRHGVFKRFYENGNVSRIEKWYYGVFQQIDCFDENGSKIETDNSHKMYEYLDLSILSKFISTEMKYPKYARRKHIEGTVHVRFVVISDGTLHDIQVVKGTEEHLDKEALRIVQAIPYWRIDIQSLMPIRFTFTLPIKFTLK